ncbi:hypothetical protein M422DRAFT_33268 [Sphaerobolus stellatus SS14]|uniref:BTB domain-containing protein n=1 Tax=Sphaerobolus stellatus (strain SS14) TaxID=990650 RepID=A0A0C9VL32_SPHS4|nr:hypothetical protein M422DRAFT_33268 [Sphaerobolus stellatus SS14]
MSSPGNTPNDIQSHLYLSLLKGYTADVTLHARGTDWEALYHLHRVVLIQAGFFRDLFTAGFLESHKRRNGGGGYFSPTDEVYVRFDDVNITRAAFEICIARLYGGGPSLYLSPWLIPSSTCPLTPAFYLPDQPPPCPAGQHPATPRFLLSLLATSIYLSIPSMISQALSLILTSVGPYTVIRYLNFAMGNGIGSSNGEDPDIAVGLENVGRDPNCDDHSQVSISNVDMSEVASIDSDLSCKMGRISMEFGKEAEQTDTISMADPSSDGPAFNYGAIGDKIGEACACWLVRWSADLLPHEENSRSTPESDLSQLFPHGRPRRRVSPSRSSASPVKPLRIWSRGGLCERWACALISSNDFFIKGEWERYDIATRVLDLRRLDGIDEVEEREWAKLFRTSINYCHMSFDELSYIIKDTSPITGHPYVPKEIIHAAHWKQTQLRHRIFTRPNPSSPVPSSSPAPREKELGITFKTSDILASVSDDTWADIPRTKPLYPVPVDSSQRIGDPDHGYASGSASIEQLMGNVPQPTDGQVIPRQSNFFGIFTPLVTAGNCANEDVSGKTQWTPFPPFRFGIEFWGVSQLSEKSRMHSHTIWYAGSLFNVYIQVVRKKGIQLGVYVHRQSSVDAMPHPSSPPPISTRGERLLNSQALLSPGSPATPIAIQRRLRINVSAGGAQPVMGSPSTAVAPVAVPGSPRSPSSPVSSPFTSSTPPAAPVPVAPTQPYRDPRPVVSAYFMISSASFTGSSLTRFTSSPDQFAISQSWGWKSSSLQADDSTNGDQPNPESSLRATVILGLV